MYFVFVKKGIDDLIFRSDADRINCDKTPAPFEVFDRNAKRMQRDRAASRVVNSREVDYLRDEVAARVADRLLDIKRRYHTVVEIGSGCGHLAKCVDDDIMDKLIMYEMAEGALNRDKDVEYSVGVERRQCDEENLQFEPESLDAAISSLSMHWVNDLPGMLIQIRKALVPDGVFIGAMIGGDSLFELRTSLQLADLDRDGGIAARVSPLTDTRDVGSLLNRAGLTLSTIDLDTIVVNYPSMLHLVSDINAMGEGNAVVQRLPYIKRDTLLAASAIYKELHGNEDGSIPATFQIIYMIGWKPDPSQPQPLPRGSGQVSLGEMFGSTSQKL
ncbi:S-adenosyl-L-methionine-dependent methyltransferase [Coemansia spiralis]|nr:S-adenosyl-L-methionine-dependent methyltransferase [Coemansia spiralis]